MLKAYGADISVADKTVTLQPTNELFGQKVEVPGDISSAAYFIVAGLITPDSEILIKNVGINPTRDGILKVCKDMGGNIEILNENDTNGEPTADLLVKYSKLHGTTIEGSIIPTLIDEIDRIMSAQKARGADFESGNLINRIKALFPIFIPLFISAFKRAIELTDAMSCRCYTGGEGRTRLRQMKFSWRDVVGSIVTVAVCAGVIVLNYFFVHLI